MNKDIHKDTVEIIPELEKLEKDNCHLPQVFAEVFKDEINANQEDDLYNSVKKFISKYAKDEFSISLINEFTVAISGGASLNEILQITKDEVISPTLSTGLTTSQDCEVSENTDNI